MQKPTPEQLEPQSDAAAEGTGVFEEESAPSVPVSPPRTLAEQPPKFVRTALVEEVIGTLGRVDLFDADSLKALRATCTTFRDLMDATGTVSSAKFILNGGLDLLEAWAVGTRFTPRTRSLSIDGEMPEELAKHVLEMLIDQTPPISKLKLLDVGAPADTLLTAPLDTLRELHIRLGFRQSLFLRYIINNTSFTGLESFILERGSGIEASDLAAALAHFRGLQSLSLIATRIRGDDVNSKVLKNSLTRLETLEMSSCRGIDKLGLLGAAGPALPALRNCKLRGNCTLSTSPVWFGDITTLSLIGVHLTSPEVAEALSGGPLEELCLNLGLEPDAFIHWDWASLELPHLTRFDLLDYPGDAMGDVAKARLPALRIVTIPFGHYTTASSVEAFSSAFPELSEMKLSGTWNQAAPTAATVEALGREIVPRLESLQWDAHVEANEVAALLHSLLPAGPADDAPCWPRLRSLNLHLRVEEGSQLTSEVQSDAYQIVARAAPHMPFLVSLCTDLGYDKSPETVDAFVTAAKEVRAWPLLRQIRVQCPYGARRYNFAEELHEVWPQATVV